MKPESIFSVVVVLLVCLLMVEFQWFIIKGVDGSTNGTCSSYNSIVSHCEVLTKEITELTCIQKILSDVLEVLNRNGALNGGIISVRRKQLDQINNALNQLQKEMVYLMESEEYLANVPILVSNNQSTPVTPVINNQSIPVNNTQPIPVTPVNNNQSMPVNNNQSIPVNNIKPNIVWDGQAFSYGDGSRARSCKEYRHPTLPYVYENQGSGMYAIEPTSGLILNVYCDMSTDGGGWTLIAGIRSDTANVHFHIFEDLTAINSSSSSSFHIKTSALLAISVQVRAATDSSSIPVTTFYQSNWPFSAACNITPALRSAIQNTPAINNKDLAASCVNLSGLTSIPTHFTYGKSENGHSTGFRMGFPYSTVSGHMTTLSYATFSYLGAPEGSVGANNGVYYTFNGEGSRNGAVFLR